MLKKMGNTITKGLIEALPKMVSFSYEDGRISFAVQEGAEPLLKALLYEVTTEMPRDPTSPSEKHYRSFKSNDDTRQIMRFIRGEIAKIYSSLSKEQRQQLVSRYSSESDLVDALKNLTKKLCSSIAHKCGVEISD